jgi:hypothetical protein
MTPNTTQIKHSEIFSSVESFLEFLSPKDVGGDERKECRPYLLPLWHPMSIKGMGLIALCEKLEDGKIRLVFSFPVNKSIPLNISIANNWMVNEEFISPFEGVAAFFVNGTQFGTKDGTAVIIEGPKEFTWIYKEPEAILCAECASTEKTND